MGPQGIEPCPLVLQTSVRTSYTKAPCLFRVFIELKDRTTYKLFAQIERFELPSKVLETRMLPLHHIRIYVHLERFELPLSGS